MNSNHVNIWLNEEPLKSHNGGRYIKPAVEPPWKQHRSPKNRPLKRSDIDTIHGITG